MSSSADSKEQLEQGALEGLESREQFTPQEREAIAATIESEIATLLPELPGGIAEIAARAVGISLAITDKLASPTTPLESRQPDHKEES